MGTLQRLQRELSTTDFQNPSIGKLFQNAVFPQIVSGGADSEEWTTANFNDFLFKFVLARKSMIKRFSLSLTAFSNMQIFIFIIMANRTLLTAEGEDKDLVKKWQDAKEGIFRTLNVSIEPADQNGEAVPQAEQTAIKRMVRGTMEFAYHWGIQGVRKNLGNMLVLQYDYAAYYKGNRPTTMAPRSETLKIIAAMTKWYDDPELRSELTREETRIMKSLRTLKDGVLDPPIDGNQNPAPRVAVEEDQGDIEENQRH